MTQSVEELAGLLTQPLEDSVLSLEHGVFGDVQFRGDPGYGQAVDGGSLKGFPGGRLEVGTDDFQQHFKHMFVMVEVPLARQVSVRIGKLVEEPLGGVESDGWPSVSSLAGASRLVHRDLPEPGSERPLPLPLEPGKLANHDEKDVLRQVVGLVSQTGNSPEPLADERQVNVLKPEPVGMVRAGLSQPVE